MPNCQNETKQKPDYLEWRLNIALGSCFRLLAVVLAGRERNQLDTKVFQTDYTKTPSRSFPAVGYSPQSGLVVAFVTVCYAVVTYLQRCLADAWPPKLFSQSSQSVHGAQRKTRKTRDDQVRNYSFWHNIRQVFWL